jgi:hypothetical protein
MQQSIINERLCMGRTKTPLLLVSIHFRGGNYAVIGLGLGHLVPFIIKVKESV